MDAQDVITSLPDHLLHCILKFMDVRDVIQTSLLSKRWRYVWKSSPYLTITMPYYRPQSHFQDFMDRLLSNRDTLVNVHRFCLGCESYHLDNTPAWLSYLYAKNIQEIELCGFRANEDVVVSLFEKVRSLTLARVKFKGRRENAALFLNSPILETLVLQGCWYHKIIDNTFIFDTYRDVKICAPCLKLLKIQGEDFTRSYTLENLSSLVTAVIDVNVYYEGSMSNAEKQQLNNILMGLVHAKSLTYPSQTFKVCSEDSNFLKMVPTFQNLRYLKLTRWETSSSSISSIIKLLQICPNVETLVLEEVSPPELWKEDVEADLWSWCMHCHLKTIEIEIKLWTVYEIELKFLQFLMKNASSLKNVVLTMRDSSSPGEEQLVDLCKKLKVVPKVRDLLICEGFQLKLRISSSSITVQLEST